MCKKIAAFIIAAAVLFLVCCLPVYALSGISAESCIVMDVATNQVIYEDGARARMSMASTTKIMTGILAIEMLEPDEIVRITPQMVTVEGSSMGLQTGDEISVRGLLSGLLLESGNDAANAIALHMAKTVPDFAKIMNEKAQKLGMKDTKFVTPSGLDDKEHLTTAYDMALLASHAMKNELFAEIVSSKKEKVTFVSPPKTVTYYNHNRLLSMYDGAIGVKTGFTKKSGRCLVSAAMRDGAKIVAVTLNASSDWNDHKKLLDYGFTQMEKVVLDDSLPQSVDVVSSDKTKIGIYVNEDASVTLIKTDKKLDRVINLPRFLYADIQKDDRVGEICYYYNGSLIYTADVFAAEDARISVRELGFWEKFKMKIFS